MLDVFGDLPFMALIADWRLPAALVFAGLAGLVRGFSGFGSALVFIPLIGALYGPQLAAGTFLLIDLAVAATLIPSFIRVARWRDVLPMAAAGVFAGQFGAVILKYANPVALRWAISVLVLAVVGLLASGWRYKGKPRLSMTLLVGVASGLLGSSVQLAGPPVIMYWLGGAVDLITVRANFLAYFMLLSSGLVGTFLARGLITPEAVALALLTGPLQVAATFFGARLFHVASARTYRVVAYVVIALVALLSMPMLDRFYR